MLLDGLRLFLSEQGRTRQSAGSPFLKLKVYVK